MNLARRGVLILVFVAAVLVALSLGCGRRPPSRSEIEPAIDRACAHALNSLGTTLNGYPSYDWQTCGTRVLKIGLYDRRRYSWPVRARTCCSLVSTVIGADTLRVRPDSITAVYRLTQNEFGEWVANLERTDQDP